MDFEWANLICTGRTLPVDVFLLVYILMCFKFIFALKIIYSDSLCCVLNVVFGDFLAACVLWHCARWECVGVRHGTERLRA